MTSRFTTHLLVTNQPLKRTEFLTLETAFVIIQSQTAKQQAKTELPALYFIFKGTVPLLALL